MKKVLAFSFFPAFVPPSNGGEARVFNFYRALSRLHHVTLLTSGHLDAEDEVVRHGANFIERRVPKDEFFARKWQELLPHGSGGDLSAPCIAACGRLPTRLHAAYLEEYEHADVIVHDFPFTVDYDIFAGLDDKLRIYNAHNCETDLYRTLHPEYRSAAIHSLVEQAERKMLGVVDCVLYCAESDLQSFARMAPEARYETLFAPNGMLALPTADKRSPVGGMLNAVFIGSGHPPNVQAARFIANVLAPSVPDIVFHILGDCLPEGKYPVNVIRHGFVEPERKQEVLSSADIALNPMELGSGSNVKIFDYFSNAVPVLSSPIGVRGVDVTPGKDCLVAELAEFATVLDAWSARPDGLRQIGRAGYALGKARYTWDSIAKPVADYIGRRGRGGTGKEARHVLVLNDYNSFTSVGGGATRTRGLYSMVAEWCPVIFVCFSNEQEIGIDQFGPDTTVISLPKTRAHIQELTLSNSLSHITTDDIVASMHAANNDWLLSVYSVLKKNARTIVIEHPYMAEVPLLFGDRFIYSSQNNETQLKRKLLVNHPQGSKLVSWVERLERRAIECAAAVIAVSDDDALSLTQGVRTAGPIVTIRNGAEEPVCPSVDDFARVRSEVSSNSAVFLGSGHPPNIEAVNFIVERLAPACPNIDFHIIGSVCSAVTARRGNIRLWGVLDEACKAAVMQSCSIAINPMASGSGSNVKLADFLANGLYVVTTEFGQRGYPGVIQEHVSVVDLGDFIPAVCSAVSRFQDEPEHAREARKEAFAEHLSMKALAKHYVEFLQGLERPRKRVLFVTYRYTSPALGGAEVMIEHLLRSLDDTGLFAIDLVAPEVSGMRNQYRFMEDYRFEQDAAAFIDLRNTRFARFPLEDGPVEERRKALRAYWDAQLIFERKVYESLQGGVSRSGLAWGWGGVEEGGTQGRYRWAFSSCALHLSRASRVGIKGYAPVPGALLIQDGEGCLLYNERISGSFEVEIEAGCGVVELLISHDFALAMDARSLAFMLQQAMIDGQPLDLEAPVLTSVADMDPEIGFEVLHAASLATRGELGIRLTDLRGPWSPGLEVFLEQNIHKYDLVVTHNNVFRPAVVAVEQANRKSVPVIMIPHAHLEDDYYHFPDLLDSATQASLVLASPQAACAFYERRGCNVAYLPAGIDTSETFGAEDVAAFKGLYGADEPFVLVLGRKAGAKGYRQIIDAVSALSDQLSLRVVLIGPDDDGLPVSSPCATYLGRQPREVVRGALMSCLALVNMSASESFGIVLLEAWMAGKPVVANKGCAAFRDMAVDEGNALLVDSAGLKAALLRLATDSALCERLAVEGRKNLLHYDWKSVGDDFVRQCLGLAGDS